MLYPIGIQNFEKIRQGGFLYVDKTNLIYQIVQTGGYYFLSRPRRFGKSLLVSTMEAYFQGKKELFKGLAIEQLEKEWNAWPVLHLDLSGVTYTDESVLNEKMESTLRLWEKAYDVANDFKSDSVRFYNIIDAAYEKTGKPVAILIDEYDKPLLDSVGNEPLPSGLGRQRTPPGSLPQPPARLLQRDEEPGRQTPLRIPHRGHQTRQAQHIQRTQQPQRHLHGLGVLQPLRHLGIRTPCLFRPRSGCHGAGQPIDQRGMLRQAEGLLRRLPFLRERR